MVLNVLVPNLTLCDVVCFTELEGEIHNLKQKIIDLGEFDLSLYNCFWCNDKLK